MDNTGDTKCKVFDKNAQELIGVSVEDLLEGNWEEVIYHQVFKSKNIIKYNH